MSTPLNGHVRDERLSEYLDGGLLERERHEIETHLADCAECATLAHELRAVIVQAGRVEMSSTPEADLWPGIEARLTTRVHPIARWFRGGGVPRRITFTLPQLAAAAAALIVFSGAGAWWMASRTPLGGGSTATNTVTHRPGATEPMASNTDPGLASTGTGLTPAGSNTSRTSTGNGQVMAVTAGFDESRYQVAIDELSAVLRTHRDQLDPLTVKVLEQNLATIDRAILAARKALEADPGSGYLSGHLAQQLELKVWLLRRAADVVAAAQG